MKIEIKKTNGELIFSHEEKDNTFRKTINAYIKQWESLHKTKVDLQSADLSYLNLSLINLRGANLSNAALRYAALENTALTGANLYEADLYGANLSYANLDGACLIKANFTGSNLTGTNFAGADLSHADLTAAELNSATKIIDTKGVDYALCGFSGHGENGRTLMGIKINKEIIFFCGCFKGNEKDLRNFIEAGNEDYKSSRLIALETVLRLIEIKKL